MQPVPDWREQVDVGVVAAYRALSELSTLQRDGDVHRKPLPVER